MQTSSCILASAFVSFVWPRGYPKRNLLTRVDLIELTSVASNEENETWLFET